MIALRGVGRSFDGGRTWAVRGLDLTVARGELVALIGLSGSGKTTTLKMINRLVPPTEGRIEVGGRDTAEVDPVRLRRGIGYVLQRIGLFPHWTVGDNVGTVPRLLGWPEERVRARVDELLALVGLDPPTFRDRSATDLSGGQAQRVGVARALAAEPPVLLLDEPFGALDPVTRDQLQEATRALHVRLGLTTVLVTHDMAEALRLADRIAVLHEGRIVRTGAPRALLDDPGHPLVARLLEAPRHQAALLHDLEAR